MGWAGEGRPDGPSLGGKEDRAKSSPVAEGEGTPVSQGCDCGRNSHRVSLACHLCILPLASQAGATRCCFLRLKAGKSNVTVKVTSS